ncbi:amino acid adenylation domain-containing protein [Paucibacter sp. B2R-40]|uniref:non-ribosomal peptide synthetase n=1 Tax=Paucibacter sp. B2R-40 TaxID=2893554 RepID=UPI0021E452EF|nr:amino acid adenylation domain-containing protein [Paucibacter sp. B2R-40]MCV2353902.1 amino acid adenylation domain-containing protein [Paucibacter sp. B2R-40]
MGLPQAVGDEPTLRLALSLSQREVWLDQRAWPGSAHLNIGGIGFFVGPLDLDRLRKALHILTERSDALRLVPCVDGTQYLLPSFEPCLALIELGDVLDPKQAVCDYWQHSISNPFELGASPPWRFTLLRSSSQWHGVTLQFHHLVMDGWGTTQVIRTWSEIYQQLARAKGCETIAAPSYQDFIAESLAYRSSAQFERDAIYWRDQIGHQSERLAAPMIESRHKQTKSKDLPAADIFKNRLSRSEYDALARSAEALGSSIFRCLLAALGLYFSRLLGRSSVLIGVPSLNRSGRRFRSTLGMFVGVLAVQLELKPGTTGAKLLQHAGLQMQGALRHARYPLSALSQSAHLMREGRDSVLDVLLSFEVQDFGVNFGSAQFVESRQLFNGVARYPLAVTVCEFDAHADPEMIVEASQACFATGEPELLAHRLWHLAQALTEQPDRPLEQLDIVPPEERWALLEGLHKDLAQLDAPQAYIDLFEHQAALWPQRCALVWDSGSLSYGELAQRVEWLAKRLRALGAARNKVVAMAIERSANMVIALLAISRAGAAFLPLDPQAPNARLAGILADSGAVALLVDDAAVAGLAALHSRCLHVRLNEHETLDSAVPPPQALWSWARASADDLAYVLFTSGSSGRPKGVMVEHGALSRRLAWLSRVWAIDAKDRSAQGTQLGFDPSLIELLLPLTQGASIALPPPGRLHPQRLAEFILKHGATFSALVPSILPGLLAGWRGKPGLKLRVACCGGEVLAPELAARFVRETGAQLFNVYGPTEATIFATAWDCSAASSTPSHAEAPDRPTSVPCADLPLGRPIDDSRIYVLGPQQQVLPFGAIGDIYIGGGALARGYLGRPDLDQDAFCPDPFLAAPALAGSVVAFPRMYRTGDRGWLDVLGRLHFSGRIDRQIKLRGYRIEPGDIEAACCTLAGVEQAIVQKIELGGQALLHAWLVGNGSTDSQELQAGLRLRLPDYMRPSGFTWLEELPLTSTGKIDLAALPLPSGQAARSSSRRPPATAMEQALLTLWQQALSPRAASIGMDDDFFELGGDSLAALSILAAMEDRLGRPLPLQLISEHPSIARLARALSLPITRSDVLRSLSDPVGAGPGNTNSKVPAIYLAASGHGDVLRLQNLAQALQGDAGLFMLQAPLTPAPTTMQEFASLYADSIESQGQHGERPIWLAGFSVGGVTALETALELQRRGRKPLGLMLLDTIHPDAVFGGTASWRTLGWLVRKLHVQDLSMNGRRLSAMFSDPGLISQVLALRGHRCHAFDGPVLLVKSTGLASWNRLLFQGWHRLMPQRIQTQLVSGLHGSIFETQHVDELAEAVRQFLASAQIGHEDT